MSTVLWSADTAGEMEDNAAANMGLMKSRSLYHENSVDLSGHLHADVFNQKKILINGIEVKVRLVKASNQFVLMDPAGLHHVHIDEARLLLRWVKISPGILLAHAKALTKTTAKYTLTKEEVRSVTMHRGIRGETLDNIILGQLPKRIIIGFVDNKAYTGDYTLNPYNFENFGINLLCLYVDGVQIPSKPLETDFNRKK